MDESEDMLLDREDDGPDPDAVNDAERDMRLMREAEVKAGKLCATCQRNVPAPGSKDCLLCLADQEDDDL